MDDAHWKLAKRIRFVLITLFQEVLHISSNLAQQSSPRYIALKTVTNTATGPDRYQAYLRILNRALYLNRDAYSTHLPYQETSFHQRDGR